MSEDLLKRIFYLIGALIVFRLGTHIVIPFISQTALASLVEDNRSGILGMMNMFSGGALERLSIFTLGIMPYISASIVVQLMGIAIPFSLIFRDVSKPLINGMLISINIKSNDSRSKATKAAKPSSTMVQLILLSSIIFLVTT